MQGRQGQQGRLQSLVDRQPVAKPQATSTSRFAGSRRLRDPNDKLTDDRLGEPSDAIRARVESAREAQQIRFQGGTLTCNADMGVSEVREFCWVDSSGRSVLRAAMQHLGMTGRSHQRTATLTEAEQVTEQLPSAQKRLRESPLWEHLGVTRNAFHRERRLRIGSLGTAAL